MALLVCYDLETTGLSVDRARVLQLAACAWYEGEEHSFVTFIDPKVHVAPQSVRIHGITAEKLTGAPDFTEAWAKFSDFVRGLGAPSLVKLVGHNSHNFDDRILAAELERHDLCIDSIAGRVLRGDTYITARKLLRCPFASHPPSSNEKASASLGKLYENHLGVPLANAHDALADCRAVRLLLESWKALRHNLEFEPWSSAVASLRDLRDRKASSSSSSSSCTKSYVAKLVFLQPLEPVREHQPRPSPSKDRRPHCRCCPACGRIVSVFFAHHRCVR